VALLPVLGFVDVFYFRYSFVADHFQYLALPGILALIAALARHKRLAAPALAAGMAVAVLANRLQFPIGSVTETHFRPTLVKRGSSGTAPE